MRAALVIVATLALTLTPAWASDHFGTVLTVDPNTHTIVIGEVGPWQVKDGQTQVTRQAIVVAPSAQFVTSKRTREPGPAGWPGGFVEAPVAVVAE